MDRPEKTPQVAFVINLSSTGSAPSTSLVHHLDQLFLGNQFPVTWAIESPEQAKSIFQRQISFKNLDLALSLPLNRDLPFRRLHSILQAQLRELEDMTGAETSLILGNCKELRSRAAVLAQEGIGAILSTESPRNDTSFAKPLPCGLWQLNAGLSLPQPRRFWGILSGRKPSLKNLLGETSHTGTTVALISGADLDSRGSSAGSSLGRLLQETSLAAKAGQISVTTTRALIADLVDQRRIKPQRSILRAAA